ncbi:MAG: sugar ABC transporter ATP-binding protein [Bacilli bacterium]|jgi:ribose transport system ATP-binding protein|nr:sugar ABC transporter ATP-binding protein [Bacilli bacterium]
MKIEFVNINKTFNGVKVLDNINMVINGGVHALMGENGAGKSTLMKILTGVYQADEGLIKIDGSVKKYAHPQDAEKDGIIFIYQELNILPNMSVVDNIFLNKEIKKGIFLNKKVMIKESEALLEKLGLNIDVTKKAGHYSVGQQQIMEIAKALKEDAKLIIMDEPTAALSDKETNLLFKIINDLKEEGRTIIYISHRMEEIFALAQEISVLRDGKFIATKSIRDTNKEELIKMMVGREIHDIYPKKNYCSNDVILEVKDLSKKKQYHNISFQLHKGEILGFAGLMGSGRTEVMHGIFGSVPYDSGEILLNGEKLTNNISNSINNNIAFITEDRKAQGIITEFNVRDNIILTNLASVTSNNILMKSKQTKLSHNFIEKLNIKCSSLNHLLKKMSGGNQQKVVIAKWLNIEPRILIMDEPTRGVDVGAKQEIYMIIKELCEEHDLAIILVSSELPEVMGMSDRICIMNEGELMGILNKEEATQEHIMNLATGGKN